MRYVLAVLAILCGVLWAWGFATPPRHTLTVRGKQEGKYTQITVTMPQMTAAYRWLSVYLCSAEISDDGITVCSGHYERESTQELDGLRSQVYLEWRNIPARTVLITAMAFDAEGTILASQSVPMFLR